MKKKKKLVDMFERSSKSPKGFFFEILNLSLKKRFLPVFFFPPPPPALSSTFTARRISLQL